jgi:hypothetical protein
MVMPPTEAMALAERLRLRALLIGHTGGSYQMLRSGAWREN